RDPHSSVQSEECDGRHGRSTFAGANTSERFVFSAERNAPSTHREILSTDQSEESATESDESATQNDDSAKKGGPAATPEAESLRSRPRSYERAGGAPSRLWRFGRPRRSSRSGGGAARAVASSKRTLARRMQAVLGKSPLSYVQSL